MPTRSLESDPISSAVVVGVTYMYNFTRDVRVGMYYAYTIYLEASNRHHGWIERCDLSAKVRSQFIMDD